MNRSMNFRIALILTVFALIAGPAMAHNWGCWQQGDTDVVVKNRGGGTAGAAINEWHNDTILNLNASGSTEIDVSKGNYGNTGWGGIAQIQQYSGCTIIYGVAVLNTYYPYSNNGQRGVYCQEVGHLFGLDHSNDGGCMGGGYYYSIDNNYNVVSHNISDIASKYSKDAGHADDGDHGAPLVHAVWYNNPRSLNETAELAELVVRVKVSGVYEGADIVVPHEGMPNGEHRIPTQVIGLDVVRAMRGDAPAEIELFHSGNEEFVMGGDPPYEVGETYVLFLKQREDGTYLVVSPEGRYEIERGKVIPASEREFAQKFIDLGPRALMRDVREAIER